MRNPRKVLVKPLLTEKSNTLREEENTYLFKIATAATKEDVKRSVEEVFKVNVVDVRTVNYMGKPRRRGTWVGRRSSWKKAFVRLAPGESIDIFAGL